MRLLFGLLTVTTGLLTAPASAQCPGGTCAPAPPAPAAVVRIVNATGNEQWYGSGTLVHKDDRQGIILTCAHLFREKTGHVSVVFPDETRYRAKVLAIDRLWDLAALQIAAPSAAPVTVAAEPPRPGDLLRSCGYGPDGRYRAHQGEMLGYVRPTPNQTYETLQLSGAARDGDSGGPVFNLRGELAAVLWGTDGRTIGATYCGRVRKFLASVLDRVLPDTSPSNQAPGTPETPSVPERTPLVGGPRDQLRERLDSLRGQLQNTQERLDTQERSLGEQLENLSGLMTGLKDRIAKAEATVGDGNLRTIVREVAGGIAVDRAPDLLERVLPTLLTALGWTGPPSLAMVLGLRLGARILRRRLKKRTQSAGGLLGALAKRRAKTEERAKQPAGQEEASTNASRRRVARVKPRARRVTSAVRSAVKRRSR